MSRPLHPRLLQFQPDAEQRRDALIAEAETLTETAATAQRSLDATESTRFDEIMAAVDRIHADSDRYAVLERQVGAGHFDGAPNVNRTTGGKPYDVRDWNSGDELRGRALDCLAAVDADEDAIKRAQLVIDAQLHYRGDDHNELARRIAAGSHPAYLRAFAKMCRDPHMGPSTWTDEERDAWQRSALMVSTSPTAGAMVPTQLDPTILLTNAGSSNVMRQLARIVTLTAGNVWHGISSQGVTVSYDPEVTEVSDDTPTLAAPNIPTHQAQGFVQYSVQAADDIANLSSEILTLFSDAKDRIEETKFSVGSGSDEPTGLWTKLVATSASRLASAGHDAVALADLDNVYKAVPARYRRKSSWLMNPVRSLQIKDLGTAVSAAYSGDLTTAPGGAVHGRPVYESDDAPATVTTTALDPELTLGDFSRYVIADRLGATAEFVPLLFNTANNLPDGRRGIYFRFRNGADCVDTNAFRWLASKTSA